MDSNSISESRNSGLRPKLMGVASPARARRGTLGNIEAARTASAPRREVVNTASSRGRRRATLHERLYRDRRRAALLSGSDDSRPFVVEDNARDASIEGEREGLELRPESTKSGVAQPIRRTRGNRAPPTNHGCAEWTYFPPRHLRRRLFATFSIEASWAHKAFDRTPELPMLSPRNASTPSPLPI